MKGGYHPLSRAAGLADEGIVHERAGVQQFRRSDERCDAIARWAFGALRQAFAGRPAALEAIERQERAYWAADGAEDHAVVMHAEEGVQLFQQLAALLSRAT